MSIIKFNDINKAFTEKVAEYMAKGLTLDAYAMTGSQSNEIAKVCLADKEAVYAIRLRSGYMKPENKWEFEHDIIELVVEKFPRNLSDLNDSWHTYWNGHGEDIESTVFHQLPGYRLGSRDNKVFTTDIEEWKNISEIRYERYNRTGRDWGFIKVNYIPETIINIIKTKTGRKRVSAENIYFVEKRQSDNCWHICTLFNNKYGTIIVGG